ncbi:MAG: amino acid ABC transporter ATP-binding protein [Candidatus Hadarchaeum sp.]|uniref:amino acid ABC transporter ATP-binding protein n=1 Tax=Candidatus Hadarchaeum sp. TaxID=2883567 RepID=UPI003181900F
MKGDVILEFQHVTKRFAQTVILDDFSFSFKEGMTYVVCGRSGVGKSTLLRTCNGLEPIDSGVIYFKHLKLDKKSVREIRKRVGMVFQHFNLFPHLTVLENLILGPVHALGMRKPEAVQIALSVLERVGLKDKAYSYPAQLSGGQQQRVAIARALCMNPELILFDEPTSALDPEMIGEVLAVMKDLAYEGRSMIVVTHEMGFAKEAADLICFMEGGRFLEVQPPASFLDCPQTESAKRFLAQILKL